MPRKADLPLHSNKKRAWDGPGARSRMVSAAKDSEGNINFEQAAQGFTYFTGDRSDPRQGDFKSPFADMIDGTKQVVFRGVTAALGRNDSVKGVSAGEKAKGRTFLEGQRDRFPSDDDEEKMSDTVLKFEAKETVRERGRVLVASGNQSRNRDFWTGKPYRLVPGGMRLEKWEKNPLIFYMHHMGIPLAKAEMFIEDGQLWAWDEFEFHRKEVPVFSLFGGFGMFDTSAIADLWEEKFLNTVSIHIILSKQDDKNVVEGDEEIVIPTSEVIEASIVTIPGDPDATREEEEFLKEFTERLRSKGVEKEMAECVACSFGNVWAPSLPVWADQSEQTADRSRFIQSISVPEVSMSKNKVEETALETAEVAEETPVEPAIEAATLEPTEELVIEQEIELPVSDIAEAIAQDAEAMRVIAQALFNMPEFAQHVMSAVGVQAQALEPVIHEVLPQRISVRLVGSGQRQEAQVAPAQPVARPAAVQQAFTQQPVAPVTLPGEQLNGASKRKISVLDLLPPRKS